MTTTQARRATVAVTWQTVGGADDPVDITLDLEPDLLALTFADNLTGAADDLSIDLQDRLGKWSGIWRPQFGDAVTARVMSEPWITEVDNLFVGNFAHDKIVLSGPPKRVSLKCVSAPMATGLRRRKRTRAWKGYALKGIAEDIAKRAGLALAWDGAAGLVYAQQNQIDKSDLEFLQELCKNVGRNLKVTEGQIAIFDELTRDSSPSIGEIALDGGWVKSWQIDGDDSGRYGSCTVVAINPRTGKTKKYAFPPASKPVPGLDPNGQTLEIRVSSGDVSDGEAAARAQALLRNANRFATSGTLVTVGDLGLVAGVTFDLVNAYGFDGKYIITKAGHRPTGGYETTLSIRRCIEGY